MVLINFFQAVEEDETDFRLFYQSGDSFYNFFAVICGKKRITFE